MQQGPTVYGGLRQRVGEGWLVGWLVWLAEMVGEAVSQARGLSRGRVEEDERVRECRDTVFGIEMCRLAGG